MPCKVFAIRKRCEFGDLLGDVNFMGRADELTICAAFHLHDTRDPARLLDRWRNANHLLFHPFIFRLRNGTCYVSSIVSIQQTHYRRDCSYHPRPNFA